MRWFERTSSPPPMQHGSCRTCTQFDGHPAAVERAFPNLASMSSGYASVRGNDGLCRLHGIYLSGGATCAEHTGRASPSPSVTLARRASAAI